MGHLILKKTHLSLAPRRGSATIALVAALFLAMIFILPQFSLVPDLDQSWSASGIQVFKKGEVYRLWTAMLIHADAEHLLGNLWAFFGLSFLLYGYFGWLAFPTLTFVLGGFVNLFSLLTYPPETSLVGASGMVYLMAGFWLALYAAIDRRISLSRRIMNGIGFILVVLGPSAAQLHISYRTHALGLVLGVFSGFWYFLWNKKTIRQSEYYEYEYDDETPDLLHSA